jgi:hypothetical protein
MTEATEIVFLTLKADSNLDSPGSTAAQTFKKAATTVSQQKGFLRSFWVLHKSHKSPISHGFGS